MTEKIRLEIDDATSPGLNSVEKNLDDVGDAANRAEKELNQAATAATKMGKEGSQASQKTALQLTELNQGLELLKKGFGLASRAVTALAADGSPAFKELQVAIQDVQNSLLDLGNDPGIQQFTTTIADGIKNKVVPAINSLPDYWRSAQDSIADFTAGAGEAIGVFADGTVEALQEIQVEEAKLLEIRKQQAEIQRQRDAVENKIAAMQKVIGDNDQLQQMAKISSEQEVLYLLQEEVTHLRVLAKEGRATREEQEASLKKIAILQKRQLEIPREQAEAAKKAADEEAKAYEQLGKEREQAAKDAAKAEEDFQKIVQASIDAATKAREGELKAMFDRVEKAKAELVQLIEKAQGGGGKNLLDTARNQLSPQQVRAQLVKQAQDQARANFTFAGDDARMVGAARNKAVKNAGAQAFRDFNQGKTGEGDIAGAQNTLIQTQAQAAVARGDLDQQTANALMQAAQNQQQMIQTQQQQAQVLRQIQGALNVNSNAARNTNAQARKGLLGG